MPSTISRGRCGCACRRIACRTGGGHAASAQADCGPHTRSHAARVTAPSKIPTFKLCRRTRRAKKVAAISRRSRRDACNEYLVNCTGPGLMRAGDAQFGGNALMQIGAVRVKSSDAHAVSIQIRHFVFETERWRPLVFSVERKVHRTTLQWCSDHLPTLQSRHPGENSLG